MNIFYLAHRSLSRNRFRSMTNVVAVGIAFFLFAVLSSINSTLDPAAIELSSTRMIVQNKIGITESLPLSYYERFRQIDGVKEVSPMNWFGGYYGEGDNLITTYAVDPISYLKIYPEIILSEDSKVRWVENKSGIIIGADVAARMGWAVGDVIPLRSNIFTNRNGDNVWELTIVGVFGSSEKRIDTNKIFMQFDHFNESHTFGENWTGLYLVSFEEPDNFFLISKSIDEETENSFHETRSVTESSFQQEYFKRLGDISFVIKKVIFSAFFAIMLIVCTSLYQHSIEKVKETAILKTFGFRNAKTISIDLVEAGIMIFNGFFIGFVMAYFMIDGASQSPELQNLLPGFALESRTILIGLIYAIGLTLVAALIPSFISYRVKTIHAISRDI
jgi:putative ABC transport system permease protein